MEILRSGREDAKTVLVHPVDKDDAASQERIFDALRDLGYNDFSMMTVVVNDWNVDLSPWAAPAVFGNASFGGGADKTLDFILDGCRDDKTYLIGGYSLAGLFSLWAATKTDRFLNIAAVSPSVWFPDFCGYLDTHDLMASFVYLSLGDKESHAKNPMLASVADCIMTVEKSIMCRNINCILEWNEGNHFKDCDKRCIRAFSRILENSRTEASNET